MNVQGLVNNFNEIELLASEEKPQIICLSETHVTDDINDSELILNGYNFYQVESESSHTGGVLIYMKKELNFEVINEVRNNEGSDCLEINIGDRNIMVKIILVYRSPSCSTSNFCTMFANLLEHVNVDRELIIVGDFNIDWLSDRTYKSRLQSICVDNNLCVINKEPTRLTANSATLIDYVISNSKQITAKTDPKLKISDHETIRFEITLKNNNQTKINAKYKILNYDKDIFFSSLLASDLIGVDVVNSSIDVLADLLCDELDIIVKRMIVEKNVNNGKCQWFNRKLAKLKQNKILKYEQFTFGNQNSVWDEYILARNIYKRELRLAKDNFIQKKIDTSENSQKLWKNIKNLVLNKNHCEIKNVAFKENMLYDGKEIASEFNKYFITSVEDIIAEIPKTTYSDKINVTNTVFKFKTINNRDIIEVLKSMGKKKDFKFMSAQMFLDGFEILGPILKAIFNKSILTGCFPSKWKETLVIPIQKVQNTILSEEYRPVNMLPIYEKVLEKIVEKQFRSYMEDNNFIMDQQSGFRKGYSCETALNWVVENWKNEMDNKNTVIAVFLDFKRAFETVDRKILLEKLSKYGIKNNELKWFESYLNARTQRTSVNNNVSDANEVKTGVPQGSVLGVFLFLLYINDINLAVKYCKLCMFADDALLFISGKDMHECTEKINNDLRSISEWLIINKLKLNVKKTKWMCINGCAELNVIQINGENIDRVDEFKYLGVVIDNKINLKANTEYVCKKLSKKIYFLGRIRKKMSINTAIKIYNAIVKPHFQYCSTILFLSSQGDLSRLQKLQNKAMRIILKCARLTHIRTMLQKLNWLSITQLIKLNVLLFVFKMKNNMLPKYLSNNLKYICDSQPYNLRSAQNFRLDKKATSRAQNTMMFKGLQLYNNLPSEIKSLNNIRHFKKEVIKYLKSDN